MSTGSESSVSEILPNKLYLGDHTAPHNGMQRVISLGGFEEQPHYQVCNNVDYQWIYIDDSEKEPIHKHFEETISFIHEATGPVLVHCWAGVSRSATIVIAYLMQFHAMSYDEAFYHVRQRRPVVCPNFGFQDQLMAFETQLKRGYSVPQDK